MEFFIVFLLNCSLSPPLSIVWTLGFTRMRIRFHILKPSEEGVLWKFQNKDLKLMPNQPRARNVFSYIEFHQIILPTPPYHPAHAPNITYSLCPHSVIFPSNHLLQNPV